ncbi:hypothetical protein J2S30_000689 [Herbaspirillum rubrisubalbicans]|uniref:hypothetical protein n=1 Tax=Herbaspirillum rubrisubalbicans TaxID=80842 RepID=UPI0020A1B264|nr:hypothetical protein [Herbaspirillum rubrisubalbicans]MCP1572310.1 hypothetical protein [Herbaspirillum rubrisubalbicans]
MESIAILEHEYFRLRFGWENGSGCVNWAINRLRNNEEGEDLDIVLLAAASEMDDVRPLVETILERYCGTDRLADELIAGKFVAALRVAYLNGFETIHSLDMKLSKLYSELGNVDWLTMLSRNCEYATDISEFEIPFEKEFAYISDLWTAAEDLQEFKAKYSREKSNQHDAFFKATSEI